MIIIPPTKAIGSSCKGSFSGRDVVVAMVEVVVVEVVEVVALRVVARVVVVVVVVVVTQGGQGPPQSIPSSP